MVTRAALEAHPIRSAKEGFERVVSTISYFLPLADGFDYGRYLQSWYPVLKDFFSPLLPLISDFQDYKYAALLTSFLLLVTVVLNNRLSRFTRVHAAQALVLEAWVWMPRVLESLLSPSHGALYQNLVSALWLGVASCAVLSAVAALTGNRVWLPLVSDTADAQVR